MSAKNRGKTTEDGEFYPTPRDVILALLESDLVHLPGGRWIEPCAGTGRIISTVNDYRNDVDWWMCELQPSFAPYLGALCRDRRDLVINPYGDFVHRTWGYPRAKVLIMNPPFSLAMQFVQEGLKRADWVVCLQRQGWFGTTGRSAWLAKHCPDILQLPWRPSFRPDGHRDNCEYCWFIWPPGSVSARRSGTVAMLDRPIGGQRAMF